MDIHATFSTRFLKAGAGGGYHRSPCAYSLYHRQSESFVAGWVGRKFGSMIHGGKIFEWNTRDKVYSIAHIQAVGFMQDGGAVVAA